MLISDFFEWNVFLWVSVRLLLVIWLISSAVSVFDMRHLRGWEIVLRLLAAVAILLTNPAYQAAGIVLGLGLIAYAWIGARSPNQNVAT